MTKSPTLKVRPETMAAIERIAATTRLKKSEIVAIAIERMERVAKPVISPEPAPTAQ